MSKGVCSSVASQDDEKGLAKKEEGGKKESHDNRQALQVRLRTAQPQLCNTQRSDTP